MPYAGVTWMPPGTRPWHVSLMTRYEMHSNQEGRDVTPGHTLTLEFGLGKKVSDTVDVGLIAHSYRQVTDTTGRDAIDPQRYGSYGAGLEVQFPIAGRFPTKTRIGFDFAAENLSQGPWLMLEFNFPL